MERRNRNLKGNTIMAKDKEVTLQDITVELSDGLHAAPMFYPEGEYIFVNAKNIINGRIEDVDPSKKTSYEEYLKYKIDLDKNTILYSIDGTIGNVAKYRGEKVVLGKGACYLKLKPEVDTDYIFFYLQSPQFKEYIRKMSTGSTIRHISLKTMRNHKFCLPDVFMQRRISRILSSLQNKIDINKLINENLLRQARTLFKSWFVDFDPFNEPLIEGPSGYQIPQSLKMVQIQDLPHILETGKRPKGGAVSEGIPSVGAENVKQLGVFDSSSAKYIPYEFAKIMKKGKIEGYELLLYKDGGKPGTFTPHFSMFGEGFPYEEFYINEHVFKLDFNNHGYNEFAYLYMQTDYPYHWLANNGGKAAIPGINQQNVNDIWIYHPSHPRVQEFCKWIQPLFTTIFTNCAENMKLSKLRDTLLPKLMSGELDVSKLDL